MTRHRFSLDSMAWDPYNSLNYAREDAMDTDGSDADPERNQVNQKEKAWPVRKSCAGRAFARFSARRKGEPV